ncbi:hypothetical protein SCLCIDRAFT_1216475 [Scleroderma citrinum Foug A]|uniref:Granulins domain-containing protein n=1 Tax=Scleroderma citrinum Foug A TaxID=1036808 RepID=A0A0C3DJA2_9AGAM|nr:hypothetical protein SCLCIDRAFT_1216475 [Scleroderma citrinum Foug A]
MVHFLGIASLLLFFQIALAVADSVPRKYKGNVVGRWSCASDETRCTNYTCCDPLSHCCNDSKGTCCDNNHDCVFYKLGDDATCVLKTK